MKERFAIFWQVVRREIGILTKDIDILTIILLSPLFYSLFYGTVYLHKVEKEVPIVIVDQDNSGLSRQLIRSLDATQTIKVVNVLPDLPGAKEEIEFWQVQGAVWIPQDFTRDLKNGRQAHLKVYLNNSRFLPSNDINRAVQETAATLSAAVRLQYFQAKGLNFDQALEQIQPLNVDDRNLFNWRQSYGDFLIPGVLTLILQQTLIFGLAMSVAREFEYNTFNDWQRLARRNFLTLVGGKAFFYFVLYLAYALLFFSGNFQLLKVPFRANYFAFLFFTAFFVMIVSVWGVIIGTFFRSKIVALQILVFTSYPLFLLSGFSWPMQSMPLWVQGITQLLPSTPYFLAMQRMVAMGAGLGDIAPEFGQLLFLLLFGLGVGFWRYRYLEKRYQLTISVETK